MSIEARDIRGIQIIPAITNQKIIRKPQETLLCLFCCTHNYFLNLVTGRTKLGNSGFKSENNNLQHSSDVVTQWCLVCMLPMCGICEQILITRSCTSKQSTIQQVHLMQHPQKFPWFVYISFSQCKMKLLLSRKLLYRSYQQHLSPLQ